jgi:hypothetical protein
MDDVAGRRYNAGVSATACRSLIAVIAAYALALQAVLAGFALPVMAGPSAHALCIPAGGDGQSLPPDTACPFCPLACGANGLAGIAPTAFSFVAPPAPASRHACNLAAAAPCTTPRLLPPSRAPPGA